MRGAITATALMLALASPAAGHKWYSETEDPITKLGCCGGTDCREISESDVKERAGGAFQYLPTGEITPAGRVQQSRDWRFHRCEYLIDFESGGKSYRAGDTRCFFAPPGSF